MRTFFVGLIIAVVPSTAFAELEVPNFSKGGVLIGFDYGIGLWGVDTNSLKMTEPYLTDGFVGQFQNTHTLGISLGYNILGHATIGVSFTATGWDVFAPTRGGSGSLMGTIAWHPLELVFMKKDKRPFGLDVSTFAGFGYGIVGTSASSTTPALGMDGFVAMWGLNADYFFTKNFGVGLFAKIFFLRYGTFYTDWDSAHSNPPGPGSSSGLGPSNNNEGIFSQLGIELILRVGD
jgi:hypothetical protein